MKVADLMKRPVQTATPATPVQEAARLMNEKKVGCLPVLEGGRVAGMLTDLDIRAGLAQGKDLSRASCADLMSGNVACLDHGASVEEAVRAMDASGVHHLPVLGEGGALAGILALADLAMHVMFSAAPNGPPADAEDMGEMTLGIPEPTLADEVLRLAARDAWR
ncbi:MAG TPA: CBS domain-containing protein [Burkholderiales bacterium]|nr:CBS domain-containing protein [Burkholderiales bacterium]